MAAFGTGIQYVPIVRSTTKMSIMKNGNKNKKVMTMNKWQQQ